MQLRNTELSRKTTASKKSEIFMSYPDKILFSLFQKLDYRDKENSGKKKLIGILIAYLFSNSVLSYNFYLTFDERSFMILTLTSNLFLIVLIVLSDFDNLFLGTKSYELLNTLPVKTTRIFFVKFLSAILFLLLFILAASLPQVIFFFFIDHSLIKTISYFLTNLMFCYFSVSILIFIYIFVLRHFTEKAGIILTVIQIVFFAFVFYSSTLSTRISSEQEGIFNKASIMDFGLVKYLPQNYFSNSVYIPFVFVFCMLITCAGLFLLPIFISRQYSLLLQRMNSIKKKRKSFSKINFNFSFIRNFINKYILSNNYERATYNLVKFQLRNSKFLRIKYIPMAFMPVLILVIGIISDLPNLIFFNKYIGENSFFKTAIFIMSPSVTLTLLMTSRILISNTKILDESTVNTRWIFISLPITNGSFIIKGAYKFIYINFLLPVVLVIFTLLSFRADFFTVFINIAFISTAIYFINSVSLLFDKTYPFTLENTKFNSASKFMEIMFAMLLGVILFLLQIFVFQNIIFVLISILIFATVSILLNRN